jgi:nondiscriminating aspartyl-tRNA synthetase
VDAGGDDRAGPRVPTSFREAIAVERTLCADLAATLPPPPAAPPRLLVAGWVAHIRRLGGLAFLLLRDRTGTLQAVWEGAAGHLPAREAFVEVRGVPRAEARAPGGVELVAEQIEVLAVPSCPPPFPLHRADLPVALETLLEHRAAALRHPRERAVFAVQAALTRGFRTHLDRLGYSETHTPKIVGTATEGGADVFAVDWFGRRVHLAQSPQLYKQMLVLAGFEQVYEVAAVYRAEPHDTARHLNEYVSMDVETVLLAGGTEEALIALERELLGAMFGQVESDAAPALDLLGVRALPDPARAQVLPLQEALRVVGRPDLDPEGERRLAERVGDMVFVNEWPAAARPFYAMPDPRRPGSTRSFDLILRGLEVTTGGQREHRPAMLRRALAARGMDPGPFGAYLAAFELGAPPHGGFAIGLERLTARIAGLDNVRRASLFPRDRTRVTP